MKKILLAMGVLVILAPIYAYAFPFGGQASRVLNCVYNSTIYTNLGPPRGGEFIWTTGTKTYQFGPPSHAGQWLLGLAAPPYYCIYKISPLEIYTGIAITMMGSSGSAAPPAPAMTSNQQLQTGTLPSGPQTTPTPPAATIGHVVISEVYYAVDTAHGSKPMNEWIELYNGSATAVNLSGWTLRDASTFDAIPSGVILAPNSFLVVSATSTTRTLWNIPTAQFVSLDSSIGDGLSSSGDVVTLRNAAGANVDAVSWGSNTSAFSPSVLSAPFGSSSARISLTKDTNTANDWAFRTTPTPGR